VSITDVEWQLEAEDLARSKRMMNSVLASCNPLNWNEWLADDVVLSLRLGAVDTSQIRDFRVTVACFGRPEKGRPGAC